MQSGGGEGIFAQFWDFWLISITLAQLRSFMVTLKFSPKMGGRILEQEKIAKNAEKLQKCVESAGKLWTFWSVLRPLSVFFVAHGSAVVL